MTRPLALALTAGAVVLTAAPPTHAGFTPRAQTQLQLSRYDSDGDPQDDYFERTTNGAGSPDGLSAAVTDGGALSLSTASASASAGLSGQGGPLALRTYATGSANSLFIPEVRQTASTFYAVAIAGWHDTLTVNGGGVSLDSVFVTVKVDGQLNTLGGGGAEVIATLESNGLARLTGAGTLTKEVSLSDNAGEYGLSLISIVNGSAQAASPDGESAGSAYVGATSDFLHTLTITSVLVEDAGGNLVTPESLGYTLSFDSGMASPNLLPAAVPEPASLALLGTGVVGLLGRARRRKATA